MSSGQQNQPPSSATAGISARTTGLDQRVTPDKEIEHLWRYFALHAQQRISVFNFFVVFSGVIATGIGGSLQAGRPMTFLVVVLGLLLALLSFVFSRLDQRNSELVKISERALRASEKNYLPGYAQIFEREAKAGPSSAFSEDQETQTTWTFGRSFRFLFLMMGIMGLVASFYSIYQWYQEPTAKVEQTTKAQTSVLTDPTPAPAVGSGSAGQAPRGIEGAPAAEPVNPNAKSDPATKEPPVTEKGAPPKN